MLLTGLKKEEDLFAVGVENAKKKNLLLEAS